MTEGNNMKDENGNGIKTLLREDIEEHINLRLSQFRAKPSPVQSFLTWCGGVSGLLAISGMLIFGGRLLERVDNLERTDRAMEGRLSGLEGGGSMEFQRHKSEDDARVIAIRERLAMLEKISESIPRLEQQLARSIAILEQMQKQFERQKP